MASGAGGSPPQPPPEPAPGSAAASRHELRVLAQLPARIVHATSARELRDLVGAAVAELIGPVARFELFVAERPAGTLVPAGDPRPGLSLLGHLIAAGEPVSERARLLEASRGHGDLLAAPLHDRTGLLGVLVVEAARDKRFGARDLDVLGAVAAQIALALQRLAIEQRDAAHRRLERDMVLAREVQRRFLPASPPPDCGLRVVAHYRPAFDVGGDFYDLITHGGAPGDPVTVVIGDVAGKGVPAALLMSRVSSDLRRLAASEDSPAALLAALDQALTKESAPETFVTLACVRIDPSRSRAVVGNAGHVPPLLRRAGGQVVSFGRASGPPLGIGLPDVAPPWTDQGIALAPGDTIFLMTDGLAEALDRPGDRLGLRLLASLVGESGEGGAAGSLEATCQRIVAAVERERLLKHVDDVTLVAIGFDPR